MAISLPIVLERNFHKSTPSYIAFAKEKDSCRKCALFQDYQQVIQSEGNAENPTFMLIGEAPGSDEVEQQRPFIGQAGQRLRSVLRKHIEVFNIETMLISNTLACRPLNNKFPSDTSLDGPIATCYLHWLSREIKLVQPKIIIPLGNQALKWVCNLTGITALRGKWIDLGGVNLTAGPFWAFPTFHPSYVLRCERSKTNPEVAAQFEADFETIAKEYHSHLKP